MKKVYVAGAYSGNNVLEVLQNIGKGEILAARVFMAGFAPFTPWHDKDFVTRFPEASYTVDMFYQYSIEWLKVSDVMLLVESNWEHSKGTLAEIKIAKELGMPIYKTLEQLKLKEQVQ